MDKLVVGILAHVDAGKTTLSEGLLYTCGRLKKLGRVDHQDAFLDTDPMERARGITIFSKQAVLPVDGAELTLLDTPGHADFSSEMERTLQVLDCAILVISGTDGVQGHTHTLWRLLERYGVPTFLFVNKMDLAGADKAALLAGLKAGLDEGGVDFPAPAAGRGGRPLRRGRAGALSGGRGAGRRYPHRPYRPAEALPLLVRLRPEAGGGGRIPPGAGGVRPPAPVWPRFCRPGVQDFPGQPGEPPDVDEAHRRRPAGEGGPLRPRLDGEGGSAARLLGVQVPDRGRGPSGKRGGRHRPEPHRRRGGPWGRGGGPAPRPGAGAHLPGAPPRGAGSPRRPGQAPPAGGGGSPAPPRVERAAAGDPHPAHGGGSAGDSPGAGGPALRPGDHLRPRRHRLPGDHRRPGGGRGPLRAPAPLCRGSPAAGAAPPGERPGAGRRLPPGHAGRELAAAGAHPSGGEAPPGGAHRLPHHRCAHHPGGGAGPP